MAFCKALGTSARAHAKIPHVACSRYMVESYERKRTCPLLWNVVSFMPYGPGPSSRSEEAYGSGKSVLRKSTRRRKFHQSTLRISAYLICQIAHPCALSCPLIRPGSGDLLSSCRFSSDNGAATSGRRWSSVGTPERDENFFSTVNLSEISI